MPQKKNPDIAELARGKTGRVYGDLTAILTIMKGLPLTYNRDLQEDKECLFDGADTLLASLGVFSGMIATLKINGERMEKAAGKDYMLATDVADYLVNKGETFRNAHGITARLISYAAGKGRDLAELSLDEYRDFSPLFGEDALGITKKSSVASRNITGGTAPQQVKEALKAARKTIGGSK